MKFKEGLKSSCDYFFKKKLLITIIVSVVAIGSGVGLGIVLNNFVLGQKGTDYSKMNPNDYSVDSEALLTKYESYGKLDDYSTKLKNYEMINIGYALLKKEESTMSITKGDINAAGITQTVRSTNIKKNAQFFEEQISFSSMVKLAGRTYQENDDIKYYKGSEITKETASYVETDVTNFNPENYIKNYGKTPSEPLIFLISKNTIKESTITRDGTDYIIQCKMNKKSAVLNYVVQMKTLSNLTEYPSFEILDITFKLDKDLLIKQMISHEKYFARTSGVGSTCDGILTVNYYTGKSFRIPSLSENFDYQNDGAAFIC